MKNLKKALAIGSMVLAIGVTTVTAFAIAKTPAETVAEITGRSTESVITEHAETQKTYGTIAKESGKLDEFKAASLEAKKENLDEKVAAGEISREKADSIISTIEKNQAECDGNGNARAGRGSGLGNGSGQCSGSNCSSGSGRGNRSEHGMRNGNCMK